MTSKILRKRPDCAPPNSFVIRHPRCFLLDRVTDGQFDLLSGERFRCVLFMRATIERAEPSGVEEALASQVRKTPPPSPDWDGGTREGAWAERQRSKYSTEGEFDRRAKTKEGRTQGRPHPCYGLDMDPPARSDAPSAKSENKSCDSLFLIGLVMASPSRPDPEYCRLEYLCLC